MFDVFLDCTVFVIMQHPCVAVKPRTVRITKPTAPLSAGKTQQLQCETTGSVPPAHIVWLLDGEPLRNAPTSVCTRHHHNLRGLSLLAPFVLKHEAWGLWVPTCYLSRLPACCKILILEDQGFYSVSFPNHGWVLSIRHVTLGRGCYQVISRGSVWPELP
jgi:hypothetical protein